MATTSGRENAYAAVLEFFPQRELAIRRLLQSSESFREICEELSDAKAELAKYRQSGEAAHNSRYAEWCDIVGRLVAEVLNSLIENDKTLRKQSL